MKDLVLKLVYFHFLFLRLFLIYFGISSPVFALCSFWGENLNQYKIQVIFQRDKQVEVKDITNELSQPMITYKENIKTNQSNLLSHLNRNTGKSFLSSKQINQEIELEGFFDFKIFTGMNHRYSSTKPFIFYNCFFFFSHNFQIVAPKIHIGNCFFIPSNINASIVFKCPDGIETSLDRIEFMASDRMFFDESVSDLERGDLSDSIDLYDCSEEYEATHEDLAIHFEGWIDFSKYKQKTDAIYMTFNKNWFVRFYYRP